MITIRKLAQAMAVAEGREMEFLRGERDAAYEDQAGHFQGYMAEAEHLISVEGVPGGNAAAIAKGLAGMDGLDQPLELHRSKAERMLGWLGNHGWGA